MALKFSEGLLSGLRNYGQGQQPRQQRGSGGGGMLTPAPQYNNASELLVKNLGKVGGVDMRTPLQVLQEQFKTIPQDDPERQLKMAKIIANSKAVPMDQRMQAMKMVQEGNERQKEALEVKGAKEITQVLVAAGPQQMNEPYVTSSVAALADEYGVTPKALAEAYENARTVHNMEDADKPGAMQTRGVGIVKDDNDRLFSVRDTYNPNTDSVDVQVTGIGHKEEFVGDPTIVSATSGLSGGEVHEFREDLARLEQRLGLEAKEKEKWDDKRRTIIKEGVNAGDVIPGVNKALAIAKRIETGGFQANIEAVKSWLGVQGADAGQFNTLAGDFVLNLLQNFPGSISNQEREFIEKMVFGLKQSPEVNVALLENAINGLRIIMDRAVWLGDNPNATEEAYDVKVLRDVKRAALPVASIFDAPQQ